MPNPFDQDGVQTSVEDLPEKTAQEWMAELVGEDKKYQSPEELAKALAHSQHHIRKLENETANLRTQTEKAKTIDDIMKQLKPDNRTNGTDTGGDDTSRIASNQTPDDLEETVKRLLSEQQSTQTKSQNQQQVINSLKATFGTKAGEVWDKVEKDLGVDLNAMAAQSPSAVLKLLGADREVQAGATGESFQSTVGTSSHGEQVPPEGSKRYVDYLVNKGKLSRADAYKLKLQYSANPSKYNS